MARLRANISGRRLRELVEAAFDVFCRQGYERAQGADDTDWLDDIEVPASAAEPGSTVEFLRGVLGRKGQWTLLAAALQSAAAGDIRAELDGVMRKQYRRMTRHRRELGLLMRSALELSGLADMFVLDLRKRLLEGLGNHLASRIAAGQIRPLPDVAATAAVMTQTIAWANLQRPFDPGLDALSEDAVENATVDIIVSGLVQPLNPL